MNCKNYPDDVSASSPDAPWNKDPVDEEPEVHCGKCNWEGSYEDRGYRVIQKRTWDDPEVWGYCCPDCGNDDLEDLQ